MIVLKKIKIEYKKYFARWWRSKELLKLTSGMVKVIADKEVDRYFNSILESKTDYHFMIISNRKIIGHISLNKRRNKWYETQVIIGEKKYRGKGYGSEAIRLLIKKAQRIKISKIYLEVRPTNIRAIRAYEHRGFKKVKIMLHPKNRYLPKTLRMELE